MAAKNDVREQILRHLLSIKRPLKWIADNTDIPYGTVYSIFIQETLELTQERLDKINAGLGTKFSLPKNKFVELKK